MIVTVSLSFCSISRKLSQDQDLQMVLEDQSLLMVRDLELNRFRSADLMVP